jgi:hypothetical protein
MRVRVFAVLVALLGLAGCAKSDDRTDVRHVTQAFYAAVEAGDGAKACEQLSQALREELEKSEQAPCEEAILTQELTGSEVARVEVFSTNARATLLEGEDVFLDETRRGWRISAAGCRTAGASVPEDCEVSV